MRFLTKVGASLGVFALFAVPFLAFGQSPDPIAEATSTLAEYRDGITTIIFAGLALVASLVASLIGFMYVYRWLRNRIGTPR